jgi:hypothetical protein
MSEIDDLDDMAPEGGPFIPKMNRGKFRGNERCVHVAYGKKCKAPRMAQSKYCRSHRPEDVECT